MSKSNYTLTSEQKVLLQKIARDLQSRIEDLCLDHEILDVYDEEGKFDNNKFTAILWYIGDELSVA
jgi:hypothetical protein